MKRKVILCIILLCVIIAVFFDSIYSVSENILLSINCENVESISVATNGYLRLKDSTIKKNITEKSEIERYINKLNKLKFYKSSDKQFGQRDFTTVININKKDGGIIKVCMVSLQVIIYEMQSPEGINKSSDLYYISPFRWLSLVK